jgi:hypothetical protein
MFFRVCLIAVFTSAVPAQAELTRRQVDLWLDSNIQTWRWHLGEAAGAERPDFNDSQWQEVELGFRWWPHDSSGWFRTRIIVPESVNGIPVKGGPIRMRAGVDNGARAYVDGVFKQEFEWSNGDFVLTENAQPGAVISVALQATNRPGSGSLYEARLVNGRAEALVDGLRGLTRMLDAALEDQDYVPPAEAGHWRQMTQNALKMLEVAAYRAGDRDKFLGSVEKAIEVLLSDKITVEERLKQTALNLEALKQKIQKRREAGQPVAYETADARVVESFLGYVPDDMAETNHLHQIRGIKGAAYIERLCLQALESGAGNDAPVPRYRTAPCSIRDGAFWQDERPVYFTGVGHFGQARQDLPILNDYGLNIIQFEMGPANALSTPDKVDIAAIRENVVQWLDKAAAQNVAVNLLISPHYFPAWAFDADPAHRQCGHGFLKFCIEAPNTRVVMEKWLDALMPLIAHHPALPAT